ncbi:MAG: glutamate synthase (NADPH), homotetrameric [Thermoplasmata archaeon HGW-Thermoplasmata-2]|nr:MAG: glutamate synthase (NADPH), homotetrameric [Thermoplasmata archaeon HGW-Thermoplasmata-2]
MASKTKTPIPEQDAHARAKNFDEVALGYTEEQAVQEASRCIQCKTRPCAEGCPVGVLIPEFIKLIKERKFAEAAAKMKERISLTAVCGRVCPQEEQCEKVCTLRKLGDPVGIGRLERFIADWERAHGVRIPVPPKPNGRSAAIVGAGPAGLTCAGELAKIGYKVTIFESLHKPGGVLVYGIPEFRLPKAIVAAEVDYVRKLGVEIKTDVVVGRTITVDEILKNYDAVFLGTGAGLPQFMNIPGENLNGVYSANEFLTRVNLMKAYKFPEYDTPVNAGKRVVVIGGGNVAMDSARCALRLGAESTIVYRRSEEEMPARKEETHHAKEEGVKFELLAAPVQILGESGRVRGLECIRMKLGEQDTSGRRRPVPIPESNFTIECDAVIVAIGQTPNPLIPQTTPGLSIEPKHGTIIVNEALLTSRERIWAGGDATTGAATVISAMGAGRNAAREIDKFLRG